MNQQPTLCFDHDPLEWDADLKELMRLCLLPGIGPRTLANLLDAMGTAGAVLSASHADLVQVASVGDKLAKTIQNASDYVDVEDVIAWCRAHDASVLVRGRDGYPESLEDLSDPPPILFYQGTWQESDAIAVGIVGTRHPTPYGLKQTKRLAFDLANAGVVVVSGLARGVDTAAHRAALDAGGRTIGILGGGLGEMYPAENQGLADQIAESGMVISEYDPSTKPKSGMFPQRNRLIAAMSLATVVIEAPQRSGSLITARLASELGRSVGGLPGPVTSRVSAGVHELIRDGATLIQHVDDVLELLGPMTQPVQSADNVEIRDGRELTLNDVERQVLGCIDVAATAIDEVTLRCGLPVSRVNAVLSMLEMKRFIRRVSGQYVVRV